MKTNDTPAKVRGLLTVLNAVTILQPVGDKELERHIPGSVKVARVLERSKLVRRLRDGKWIATPRGLAVGSTQELGRRRDISRMFQLIERARRE